MRDSYKSIVPQKLNSWEEERNTLANHIKQMARSNDELNILEAGCGYGWGLDLGSVKYILTGVDIDKNALDVRKNKRKDLDIAIHGDLSTVTLEESYYDVIYCSYVLEHVDGAEDLLKNFVCWLKPGGILLLIIPNRDSVKGFLTRLLPFWIHILIKYLEREKMAGKPGYGPFPTFFDKVVSRAGIYKFCEKNGLVIRSEYSAGHGRKIRWIFKILSRPIYWAVHLGSLRRLSIKHMDLIYFIEKL